ncbi:hypothetical protein RhiJN_03000 [Ceratobasidium sp. AG-Ba]|nr:hypothetical protein RhiJN_03000 [Ceratobasidium sp. AG-Ba]QRW03888.1 hypothetical protein RhiLY_02887 [Ceratobasidium sp. AG-Ba]
MTTLLERAANILSDVSHVVRTPSLTDTDDSGPSDEVPLSPPPAPSPSLPPSAKAQKSRHPLLVNTSRPLPSPKAPASPVTTGSPRTHVRTNSHASSLMFFLQRPIVMVLSQVGVLARVLRYLTWHEFRNLVMTSRTVRAALETDERMDVILARFVPGYRYGVRPSNQIHVSLDDLETYILSQHISLHLYPTHALSVVDSLMNMMQLVSATTERFQKLTAAHSRFVLLLRSRAVVSPNALEIDDTAIVSAAAASKDATATRQLTFPAPLFCAALQQREPSKNTPPTQLTKQLHRRRLSGSTSSLTSLFSLSVKGSRRKRPIPPPAPLTRRSSIIVSAHKRASTYGHPPRSRSTPPQMSSSSEGDDLSVLKPPRPFYRRGSSLPGSSASSTRGSLGVVSESAAEHSASDHSAHIPIPAGPHDPLYATVRGRAPVLRVFVPTDTLSAASIKACEALLYRAGVWEHMAPGDIVCNLGYVPRQESDRQPRSSSQAPTVDEFGVVGPGSFANLLGDTKPEDLQGWLIFTGKILVPYFPPAPPPPDIDALRLPGPAYYAHLGQPTTGLVYALKIPRMSSERTMRLERSAGLVRTTWGVARVWRWNWVAEFRVERSGNMAEEWAGDWVLEGMGTREGEKVLVDAMDGGDMHFWEYVREKSGNGRIWLRLLDTPALSVPDGGSAVVLPGVVTEPEASSSS